MSTRFIRTVYTVVIAGLLLGLAGAGAWGIYTSNQTDAAERDGARVNDLLRWRQVLADYHARTGRFPTPDQREQAFAELEQQGAPIPPKTQPSEPHYRYSADQPGGFYVMCAALERPPESAGRSTTETAYFVTAGGSFMAKAEYCTDALPVRTANFVTATSMTTDAANTLLGIPTTLENKERIRELCAGTRDTRTAVYGCFRTGKPESIAILEITDPGLRSQTDVVAAHELLHAAYERLEPAERARVDKLLAEQAAQPGFEVLAEELTLYAEAERTGELHSRLATEYAGLSPELERYYARYFRTRGPLVAKYEPYRALLSNIRNQEAHLEQSRTRLEALLADGQDDAYNDGVGPYNREVAEYNVLANRYNLLTR